GRLAREQRYEDAARLRDRIAAVESVAGRLGELRRLRALRVCLLVPAKEPGFVRAVLLSRGRVAARRTIPVGAGAPVEVDAALADANVSPAMPDPAEDAALGVVASFLRRPPPELRVLPLERRAILTALGVAFAA